MSRLGSILSLLGLLAAAHAVNPFEIQRRHLTQQECKDYSFAELTPTITHAPVLDLQWVGDDDQTVFAVTHKYLSEAGGIWRSKNAGLSFVDLTPKLNETAGASEAFSVMAIFSQKGNQANVLLIGTGSYTWLSADRGETFTAVPNQGGWKGSGIRGIKIHPRRDNWLLLLVKRPNCKVLDKAQMECPYDLILNQDVFNKDSKWINLTSNSNGKVAGFVDFDWGASLCPSSNCTDLPAIPDELILATTYARPGDYDQPWDKDVNFVTSTDFFASSTTRVRCGNMFEVVGRSVYMALANSCETDPDGRPRSSKSSFPQGITLYTSMNAGDSFTQACLPVALKQEGYELVETHDGRGAVVIVDFSVSTGFMELPASSVYTAGPHHALFSLSLTNVYHAEFGTTTDFTRVEGVPGIYIANQMLAKAPGEGQGSSQLPPEGQEDSSYYYDALYDYDLEDLTEKPLVETRITFNGGGRWQRLPAPPSSEFRDASCDVCQGRSPCYLHLHGLSDWDNIGISLPAVYSNPSAPGLIMATGNTAPLGLGLDRETGLCTYLSRDGGVSWSQVGVGAFIYEFADWGGVIVMARHPGEVVSGPGAAAEELRFSMDYGRCWQRVPLQVPLLVDNIRIEPDGQRAQVVVHGRACKNTTNPKCSQAQLSEGLMYMLDVEKLMRADGYGDCADPDYETWPVPLSAKDTSVPRCVLGEHLSLTRRKKDSKCFQGGNYKRPRPMTDPCNCTREQDTECEYGYIKSNDTCVAIPDDRMPTCPVIASGTYTVSDTRRRLVHGDTCLNPDGIMPDTGGTGKAKSNTGGGPGGGSTHRGGGGWVTLLVVLLVLVALSGLFGAWWQFRATEDQRDTVRELGGSVANNAAAAWGLLVDKVSGLFGRLRPGNHTAVPSGGEELGYFQPLGDPGYDVEGRGNIFTLK